MNLWRLGGGWGGERSANVGDLKNQVIGTEGIPRIGSPGINWVGAEAERTPDELQPPRSFLNETRETQPGQRVPSRAGVRGRRRDRSLSRRSEGFSWLHDS